jgi:hypothetical protein
MGASELWVPMLADMLLSRSCNEAIKRSDQQVWRPTLIPTSISLTLTMPAPTGLAHYASLRNNAAPWWFQDAGMRKMAIAIGVGFAGTINGGESSNE